MRKAALVLCFLLLAFQAWAGMNLDGYVLTWEQDFTTMKTLDVTPHGPNSTWTAHTPSYKDWNDFLDPQGDYTPFHVDGTGPLVIRAQQINGQNTAGLLCSVDSDGNGFAQKYGYFEMKAQLPTGNGVWPAFWLLDVESLKDHTLNGREIDVVEQYGDILLYTTLHDWVGPDGAAQGQQTWSDFRATTRCDILTGYHTYGVDIQEDFVSFYYDRLQVWQFANSVPGVGTDKFDRTMFVLVNLAYRDVADLSKPWDMLVEYVKVWQGYGGSANGASTEDSKSVLWTTLTFDLQSGTTIPAKGVQLTLTTDGDLQVLDSIGNLIWHTNTGGKACKTGCNANFQSDGNFILYDSGNWAWGSNTWGNNMGQMILSSVAPYYQINNGSCDIMWSTGVTTPSCNGIIAWDTVHVCNGVGTCVAQDQCRCNNPSTDPFCAPAPQCESASIVPCIDPSTSEVYGSQFPAGSPVCFQHTVNGQSGLFCLRDVNDPNYYPCACATATPSNAVSGDSASYNGANTSNWSLTTAQLAGIIVGSILVALVLIALVAWLVIRRKPQAGEEYA